MKTILSILLICASFIAFNEISTELFAGAATTAMLPLAIMKRFKNPGELEEEFMQYLSDAKLDFAQSKTIASVSLYNQQLVTGQRTSFFSSAPYVLADTNIPGGSFTRPQSEHFVIYGVRISYGDAEALTAVEQYYTPGNAANTAFFSNANFTLNNNGINVLKDYPVAESLQDLTTKDAGLILLDEPVIWAGSTELDCELVSKSAVPPQNAAIRITLIGIGLI